MCRFLVLSSNSQLHCGMEENCGDSGIFWFLKPCGKFRVGDRKCWCVCRELRDNAQQICRVWLRWRKGVGSGRVFFPFLRTNEEKKSNTAFIYVVFCLLPSQKRCKYHCFPPSSENTRKQKLPNSKKKPFQRWQRSKCPMLQSPLPMFWGWLSIPSQVYGIWRTAARNEFRYCNLSLIWCNVQ